MFIERSKICEIADKVTSWIESDGFECVDLSWDPQPRILTVYIDHPNGVGFEQCVSISEKLVQNEELDQMIPCDFSLEVSSPGIERPLRTQSHFMQAFNDKVQIDVKLIEKVNGRKKGIGSIDKIDGEQLTLKTTEGVWVFEISKVLKANRLADWSEVSRNAKEHS
ncbi:MAG: hypothetical protein NT027_05190 [Proteobacteria bacterium]|nr:hypothetical protein [Pseudomonadota bacterium]